MGRGTRMSELISRQLLDLWNKYKPTIAVDAIEYDRELRQLLSTNLAEVGTDCISRQAAIDLLKQMRKDGNMIPWEGKDVFARIRKLPPAQPEIIQCKDCKCWVPGYITDNDDFIPPKCGKWQQMVGHSSDDYCSLAERREDE